MYELHTEALFRTHTGTQSSHFLLTNNTETLQWSCFSSF